MIAIIDYGMGNLRSVQKALEKAGAKDVRVTSDAAVISAAGKIVLPGVGASRPAMDKLNELKLPALIEKEVKSGKPFLGICLGFQLLFEKSFEGGEVAGLGLLAGTVERFPSSVKVPQMGWNDLTVTANGEPMFKGLKANPFVYFCHSYFVSPKDPSIVAATTTYGSAYASAIRSNNIWGVQFHPEKSQDVGLTVLRNFVAL